MPKQRIITPDEVIAAWGGDYHIGTAIALIHKALVKDGSTEDLRNAAEHLGASAYMAENAVQRAKWRKNKKKLRTKGTKETKKNGGAPQPAGGAS